MKSPTKAALLAMLALALHCGPVLAGQQCLEVLTTPEKTAAAIAKASRLTQWLDAQSSTAVIIGRQGQSLAQYGITYSHVAFALKTEDGAWQVIHELNTCGTDHSGLFVQGLTEFLIEAPDATPTAVLELQPDAAERLKAVLASMDETKRMYEKHYSAVAYPFATMYQNSDGWILETLARAVAVDPPADRAAAQSWLQNAGYVPSLIHLGPLTRLGARMSRANIAFDDHPGEFRFTDRIYTNTGDSTLRFISRYSLKVDCQHTLTEQVCAVN